MFAAVMATGIVSVAAADHGYRMISDGLVILAAVALALLVVLAATAWRRDPLDMRDPDLLVRLFTFVAAWAVLGSRLAVHHVVLWVCAGIALSGWLSLAPALARRMWPLRWTGLRDRARGVWELASVATSGLAILAADLELVFIALLFWVLAICIYLLMTGLILWRAVHEHAAPERFEPDIWILMGGLAIATLAGDDIHRAVVVGPFADGVRGVTIATWIVATAWIPPLVMVGLRRRVGRAGAWWAAVFPLGMYSSATYAMAVETGWRWLDVVSLVFFWLAFAAWAAVALLQVTAHRSRT